MASSRKRRKAVVFSLIGLALVGLTLVAVLRKKEAVITVQTEKVIRRDLTEIVVANGKIQPVTQVVISPEVAGEIITLPVKEGDCVKKGDLLIEVKPDSYIASRNSAEASYKSAIAGRELAEAELKNAESEFRRNEQLFQQKLVSESVFLDVQTAHEVSKLRFENAAHQVDQAKFGLDKATDDLSKTRIVAPIEGTVVRLNSQIGERVLGTSFNKGTEIMTIADLNEMDARVDIGETDVVLIQAGQKARLEVDAFKDREFTGIVTEIANSAKGSGQAGMGSGGNQTATQFEVKIRIQEKDAFRPGMSVTAEVETRHRTNALAVPIASLTRRPPKDTNTVASAADPGGTNSADAGSASVPGERAARSNKNAKEPAKELDVVFVVNGEKAKVMPVKIGISDDEYYEITEGLDEGMEVVSGNYRAVRDLADGKKIVKGTAKESEKKE